MNTPRERSRDELDALRAENERLRAALKGIAEYCSGDGRLVGAIDRLIAVQNTARQAILANEQTAAHPLAYVPITGAGVDAWENRKEGSGEQTTEGYHPLDKDPPPHRPVEQLTQETTIDLQSCFDKQPSR